MINKTKIGFVALLAMLLLASCHKEEVTFDTPVVGHWACEQYVSHRVDTAAGVDRWDTICYDPHADTIDYELFFYNTGKGLLKLNNSPAWIKEFSCDYVYDSIEQVVRIESSSWLMGLYGSLLHNEKNAVFNVETLTDSTFVASWTNHVSEDIPFFERFFLKRID